MARYKYQFFRHFAPFPAIVEVDTYGTAVDTPQAGCYNHADNRRHTAMGFRTYNHQRDRDAVHRIWREIGWMEEGQEECVDLFLSAARAWVADIGGSPECFVGTIPGTVRHLEDDLSLGIVGAVTTSRIARKQKIASRLTAHAVASLAADGALVSGLGMFEQGYYNRLGFGTGSYESWISFDPADLLVSSDPRVPCRITKDDWQAVHASRMARHRGHGSCNVLSPDTTRGEMMRDKTAFGLGYYDGPKGELTHFVWIKPEDVGHGPYNVLAMCWQTGDQFLELLGLLKSLGDQVHVVRVCEPAGIQLQDLLRQPMKSREVRKKSKFESFHHSIAYWQMRILDLPGCMARTHLPCADLRFNVRLHDPIETLIDGSAPWRGISGDYIVTLGQDSSAVRGEKLSLPTLKASVGAFTRMWLGVRPATGLSITDQLSGPAELLRDLDRAFLLPRPHPGWDF